MRDLCLLFPGQGSQKTGMGKDIAERHGEAARVFELVDDALNRRLSRIMWGDDEALLMQTHNAQPALMAVSMAVMRVLEAHGILDWSRVRFAAGHSLGEHSAYCATGAVSIADCARILQVRGEAMRDAVPKGAGMMAAVVGLEAADVASLCAQQKAKKEGLCVPANINDAKQIVISGHTDAVNAVMQLAKEKGARLVKRLPVSAPFHTVLMRPAEEKLAAAMQEIAIKKPVCPVIANIDAQPTQEPEAIRDKLIRQLTGQVLWYESMCYAACNQVELFLEIGAGQVLKGLAKKHRKKALSIGTAADIDVFLEDARL